jgi:adenylate kinase
VLLGPPASGKGTQGELIRLRIGIPITSTGAILRREAKADSDFGRQIQGIISAGRLAPDEIVMKVVQDWIELSGESFGFDGFPRTLPQATGFDDLLAKRHAPLEAALFLDVPETNVAKRMATRLTCRRCGKVVTVGRQVTHQAEPCPNCGGVLEVRSDDNAEALAIRIAEFRKKSVPVTDFYAKHGILTVIDGSREVEQVFADVQKAIAE